MNVTNMSEHIENFHVNFFMKNYKKKSFFITFYKVFFEEEKSWNIKLRDEKNKLEREGKRINI